jgi:hypothetical protein
VSKRGAPIVSAKNSESSGIKAAEGLTPLQRERLKTRNQIWQALHGAFGVTQKVDTLRGLFARFGIKPIASGQDPVSGRGNVGYYDPLVLWVLATYFNWPKLCESPDAVLAREIAAAHLRPAPIPDSGPPPDEPWVERPASLKATRVAYYRFISGPRWGLDIRTLDDALYRDQSLLEWTLDDSAVLEGALRLYKRAVIGRALNCVIDEVPLGAYEMKPHRYPSGATSGLETHYGLDSRALDAILESAGLYDD